MRPGICNEGSRRLLLMINLGIMFGLTNGLEEGRVWRVSIGLGFGVVASVGGEGAS